MIFLIALFAAALFATIKHFDGRGQTTPAPTPETPAQIQREYIAPEDNADPLFSDMLKQVHLLVAGVPGSGKSVALSNIIDAAMHSLPGDTAGRLQMVLIDPKKVDLLPYEHLPHVIRYASDPDTMVNALQFGLDEVNRRFSVMKSMGVRKYPGGDLYIIIDEFADLLVTDRKRVKPILQRILQIGRAANVHVIAATQYVYATIIDSTLKCLFDCRLALRTKTRIESRLIIDRTGLELLPKHGKAWYITPDCDKQIDIPYLDDNTIADHVTYWTNQD